jgi:SWIM zinc finger
VTEVSVAGQTRISRGRELYTTRWADIEFRQGSWFVPSATDADTTYEVRLKPGETCECTDFEFHGGPCKHITAAIIARAKSTECACCHGRVPWKFAHEVHEEDGLLAWFVGDVLCADCIKRGYWS